MLARPDLLLRHARGGRGTHPFVVVLSRRDPPDHTCVGRGAGRCTWPAPRRVAWHHRAQADAAAAAAQKRESGRKTKGKIEAKEKDDDPRGEKLAAVEDPLGAANKYWLWALDPARCARARGLRRRRTQCTPASTYIALDWPTHCACCTLCVLHFLCVLRCRYPRVAYLDLDVLLLRNVDALLHLDFPQPLAAVTSATTVSITWKQ